MTGSDKNTGFLGRILSALPIFSRRAGEDEARPPATPLTMPAVPLRNAVVAVVTTGGVYHDSQPPFDISYPEGDPGFREIPADAPRETLRLTQDYYDQIDAEADLNLVLPLQRLHEFQRAGALGKVHGTAYSLMGHVTGSRLEALQATAAYIAGELAAAPADYALLIPASGCCNRSVGVLARAIESAGIATISLSNSLEITKESPPPRALFLRFPFGHALGEPGNRNQQCTVLHQAFKVLFEADAPATIFASALRWRQERYLAPDWEEVKKLEPLHANGDKVNS